MAKKKSSSRKRKVKMPIEIFGIIYIVLTILGLLGAGPVGKLVRDFAIFLFGSFYIWVIIYFLLLLY